MTSELKSPPPPSMREMFPLLENHSFPLLQYPCRGLYFMFETNFPTLRLIFTGKTNANDNSKNMMFSNLATWHTGTEKKFLKAIYLIHKL